MTEDQHPTDSQPPRAGRRPLTAAQSATLRRLYASFQLAQANLNEFTRYLMEEHGVPDDGSWEIDSDLRAFLPTRSKKPEDERVPD